MRIVILVAVTVLASLSLGALAAHNGSQSSAALKESSSTTYKDASSPDTLSSQNIQSAQQSSDIEKQILNPAEKTNIRIYAKQHTVADQTSDVDSTVTVNGQSVPLPDEGTHTEIIDSGNSRTRVKTRIDSDGSSATLDISTRTVTNGEEE